MSQARLGDPAILAAHMRFHRVLLVVNPVARTVSKPTLAVIEKALSADFALEVAETKEKGTRASSPRRRSHDGIDLVVVFSGDGTINEAVNALAGTEVALARAARWRDQRARPRARAARPIRSSAPGC